MVAGQLVDIPIGIPWPTLVTGHWGHVDQIAMGQFLRNAMFVDVDLRLIGRLFIGHFDCLDD